MRTNVPRADKKQYADDDGHVIANMNVEGMPWYSEGKPFTAEGGGSSLDRRQTRYAIWGALKASLLVGLVLSLGLVALVLITLKFWVR